MAGLSSRIAMQPLTVGVLDRNALRLMAAIALLLRMTESAVSSPGPAGLSVGFHVAFIGVVLRRGVTISVALPTSLRIMTALATSRGLGQSLWMVSRGPAFRVRNRHAVALVAGIRPVA